MSSDKKNNVVVTGVFTIRDADTGEILLKSENAVVDNGLGYLMGRAKDNTTTPMSHVAVGTDGTAEDGTSTTLGSELERNPIFSSNSTNSTFRVEAFFSADEAVGTWREIGVFNASSGGTMLNRTVITFVKSNQNVFVDAEITIARG